MDKPAPADQGDSMKEVAGSGVYRITCVEAGMTYIGAAVSLPRRYRAHYGALRRGEHRNVHLQKAWDTYGADAFEFSVIEVVTERALLAEREQYWLDRTERLFNIHRLADSALGVKRRPETVERMSAANKGRKLSQEQRARFLEAVAKRRGSKHSEATKAKMSAAQSGRPKPPMSQETRHKISEAQMGKSRTFTAAHRASLSASATGRKLSQGAKDKIAAAHRGRKRVFSARHRANIKATWALRKQKEKTNAAI